MIAGYRTSGGSQRPGFAWFFGRDALWTSLALDAEGDFGSTRVALDFLSKYQRSDGKVPHEISQGANFVPWFTDYPYPYASADATPLYIIAMNDYVVSSGDVAFAREKWDSLVEGLSIPAFDLRRAGTAAEFWNRARLGGGRPAAAGPYRALPERAGRRGSASAFQSGAPDRKRRREQQTWRRFLAPTTSGEQNLLVLGKEAVCLRTR